MSSLSTMMASSAARSQNPQLSDLILDRAYFAELRAAAEKLGSRFLSGYAKTLIDGANLRAAVRTLRMKKDPEFLKSVLTEGGETDLRRVLSAASSAETLPALYAGTVFKNAAELGAPMPAFLKNLISRLRSAADDAGENKK